MEATAVCLERDIDYRHKPLTQLSSMAKNACGQYSTMGALILLNLRPHLWAERCRVTCVDGRLAGPNGISVKKSNGGAGVRGVWGVSGAILDIVGVQVDVGPPWSRTRPGLLTSTLGRQEDRLTER